MRSILAALGVVVSLACTSCGSREAPGPEEGKGKRTELILYCGAGIRTAAEAVIKGFEAKHPDIRIAATYEGSGRLLGQAASGRRGDLFMPGSSFYVDRAVEQGLAAAETQRTVAYFVPVLLVRKGNPLGVTGLSDLAEKNLRVGLGDERSVAVGRRAVELFEKNSIPLEAVNANVVYKSGTVNELGVAIDLRTCDVAIVWNAVAKQFGQTADAIAIPPEQNIITPIPIVVLKFSEHFEQAKLFVDFISGPDGRRIMQESGYTVELGAAKEE